ncbi:MAG: dihydrofolate reductase [Alphaproteobacteria bacterium]
MSIQTTLIVAMAQNHIIGKDGTLPWHIPADLKRYKARTLGKPLVMGRKTLESLYKEVGGPLPGRTNIIVTRQDDYKPKDEVIVASSLESALSRAKEIAEKDGQNEIFVNGGAQIYGQALQQNLVDILDICLIHDDVEGDTKFPDFDWRQWDEIWREDHEAANDKPAFSFVQYKRAL